MEGFVVESDVLSEWLRTFFLDDDGEVFLPCGAFADERTALLCLAHDGVQMVRNEGHIYAPASWIAKEYPRWANTVRIIADKARANACRCASAAQ
ncbi:MAG TPA: hypothetical protein PLP01_03490 [Phycisphaerae bacterium]|nr:hypothetical protein [Phycisphaerae bacterium]HOI54290.1 hypothetical protein [Phycisphaerae bacterium]